MNAATFPLRLAIWALMVLLWCNAFAQNPDSNNSVCSSPPIAPPPQWVIGNKPKAFTFEKVTAAAGADQIEWSTNADFKKSTILSSPATISVSITAGSAVVIWLRSRNSNTGCASEAVTTLARVEFEPGFMPNLPDTIDAFPCGDDMYKTLLYQYNRADYNSMIDEDNRMLQIAARTVAQQQQGSTNHSRGGSPRAGTYVIPVVVHIVYPIGEAYGTGSNISYAQIQSAINKMNASFSANYAGYNGQTNASPAINTGIRFCLANNSYPTSVQWTDPNEPGVMRYPTNNQTALAPAFNNPSTYSGPTSLSGYPTNFPPTKYFNIWSVPTIQGGGAGLTVLGFCTFPSANPTPAFDGMMIMTGALGDNSVAGSNFPGLRPSSDQGKVAVHEAGHYFGLYHVFEPNPAAGNSSCPSVTAPGAYSDGDRCLDTKPCTQRFGACSANNPCTGANDYPIDNFMNYLSQNCTSNFTSEQLTLRMQPALDDPNSNRNNLWQPANLTLTGVSCGPCILDANIDFTFTGACPGVGAPVQFTAKTGSMYCGSSYAWTFPGATSVSSTTIANPVVTYNTAGTYTATLTICDPNNRCETKSTTVVVGASSIIAEIVTTTQNVCSGNNAFIEINIPQGGTPPFTIDLSNGDVITGIWNRYTTWVLQNITATQRITITSINNDNCPATYSGYAQVNVVPCCNSNIIVNGDFSAGATGFVTGANIDMTYNATVQGCARYNVYNYAVGGAGNWFTVSQIQNLGNVYAMDAPGTGVRPGPPRHNVLWGQDNVPITACTDYVMSYNTNDGIILPNLPIVLQFQVLPPTGTTPVFTQDYVVPINSNYQSAHPNIYWMQPTFSWNSGSNAGNNYRVRIVQITNFACGGGDMALDNITMSKMNTNCIAATGTNMQICRGQCAYIGASLPAGATVSWSPSIGLSNANIANPCASPQNTTIYTATVTVNSGALCGTSIYTVTVNVDDLEADNTIPDNYVCSLPPSVPINGVTVTGGLQPYTYNWGSSGNILPANSLTPSATQAGIYTLTITDANNCTTTVSSRVELLPPMVLSLVADNSGCGGCNGTTTLTNTSPISLAPFTYRWNNNATTQNLSSLCAGGYTVTVSNGIGCTATLSATVPNIVPLSATIAMNGCAANAMSATATPAGDPLGPYTYRWSDNQTTATATNLTANTPYSVTITSSNNCTATSTITTSNALNLSITSTQVCLAGQTNTATVNATGSTPPYTYRWNNNQTTATATNLQPGLTYTVTVTASNNCVAIESVTFPDVLSTTITGQGLCGGSASIEATVTATGSTTPYGYAWSDGQSNATAVNLTAGNTYTVTVTAANNCTASNSITIPSALSILVTVNSNCTASTATVAASGGNTPYSYRWNDGQTTATTTTLQAGANYNVTVTTADGCTVSQSATIPALLSINVDASNICAGTGGASATAVATGDVSPYSYAWSNQQTTSTATGLLAATAYQVTCTSGNGCTATTSITIPSAPVISLTGKASCEDRDSGAVTATIAEGTAPYTYNWSNRKSTKDINQIPPGDYTLTITDVNGCTATETFTVANLGKPILLASPDTTVLLGHGIPLTVISATGGTGPWAYTWSPNDFLKDSAGITIASPIKNTTYTLIGTDANGCAGLATSTVNVRTIPLYIPNIFSPNGDGKNDVFYIYGSGIKTLHLTVYDRWGEMVFESNDPASGWDGTFNGELLPPDVFAYQLQVTFIDGELKNTRGSISLTR